MKHTAPPTWDDLRRIADELELKIHLAGMDARDRWNELRPRLVELETAIERTGKRAGQVITDQLTALGQALRQLRDEVADELSPPRPEP